MDAKSLINCASPEEIRDAIVQLKDAGDCDSLAIFLTVREDDTFLKQEVPRWASAALIQIGPIGVRKLGETVLTAPGIIYPSAIIESIWHATRAKRSALFSANMPTELCEPISEETSHEAKLVLKEIFQNARFNPDLFSALLFFLYHHTNIGAYLSGDDEHQVIESIYDAFTAGSIRVSKLLINEFEALIDQECPEEKYQIYLKENSVFLDPLAAEVIPKQRLGIQFITDFVLKRHDGKYILVEIEKPHDDLFTSKDDFTAHFTHAFGQVLDFQQWIDSNGEYARSLLPGISSPRGLLVMGLRSKLSDKQSEKLHRFAMNSASVDIVTYDDLIANSMNLYRSILRIQGDI